MKAESIKAGLAKALSRQVRLELTNGRTLPVPHPDFAMFSPDGSEFIISFPEGGFDIISVDEVAAVRVGPRLPPSSKVSPPTTR
ncbi:MAG TPA: hypothetical protein PLX89_02395 [Verrucomicrobiota bacterium]|nr:hypothetical protein [Verrucomicrobiales bacterium]HRI11828.1 hypothetical protein [Verrucomicrobiota bacterium]